MRIFSYRRCRFYRFKFVEYLLNKKEVELVRVLDNLATGNLKNISEFESNSKFEFMRVISAIIRPACQPAKEWI